MSHTKEPWACYHDGKREMNNISYFIKSKAGDMVSYGHMTDANARRIVAAVNACEGLPTELIEKHDVTRSGIAKGAGELEQQRDELLAALEGVIVRCAPSGYIGQDGQYLKKIRAVLAKVGAGGTAEVAA